MLDAVLVCTCIRALTPKFFLLVEQPQIFISTDKGSGVTGTYVEKNFRSHERKFHGWNFCSLELSFPGTFVPRNLRSLELSFPWVILTGNFSSQTLVPKHSLLFFSYSRSVYLACSFTSFTHAEQGSQVCRPTHLMPSSPHTRCLRPTETSWGRNRSSCNQSMPEREARWLKGSQDFLSQSLPVYDLLKVVGLYVWGWDWWLGLYCARRLYVALSGAIYYFHWRSIT